MDSTFPHVRKWEALYNATENGASFSPKKGASFPQRIRRIFLTLCKKRQRRNSNIEYISSFMIKKINISNSWKGFEGWWKQQKKIKNFIGKYGKNKKKYYKNL